MLSYFGRLLCAPKLFSVLFSSLSTLLGLSSVTTRTEAKAGAPGEALPVPVYEGGTKAITLTPIVGTPAQKFAEMYVPGDEKLTDGELRITVLGSGNPWVNRAQAAGSILVEVGNGERDLLLFDLGSGSLANFAALKLPVNKLNKVFLSHLHPDHMSDMLTLVGSYAKIGRSDGPVYLWGPSGTEPRLGTQHFANMVEEALAWDTASSSGPVNPESLKIVTSEFPFSTSQIVYERNGVSVTSFPVVHALSGSVGYRLDYAGLSFVFSGDARPSWPLVHAAQGGIDLLIHECFLPAAALAAETGLSLERATIALNAAHTSPQGAAKVFHSCDHAWQDFGILRCFRLVSFR